MQGFRSRFPLTIGDPEGKPLRPNNPWICPRGGRVLKGVGLEGKGETINPWLGLFKTPKGAVLAYDPAWGSVVCDALQAGLEGGWSQATLFFDPSLNPIPSICDQRRPELWDGRTHGMVWDLYQFLCRQQPFRVTLAAELAHLQAAIPKLWIEEKETLVAPLTSAAQVKQAAVDLMLYENHREFQLLRKDILGLRALNDLSLCRECLMHHQDFFLRGDFEFLRESGYPPASGHSTISARMDELYSWAGTPAWRNLREQRADLPLPPLRLPAPRRGFWARLFSRQAF